MSIQTQFDTDLTVQSFAYVASQLARTPSAQYEQILSEAEKHCSALRLMERDALETAEQALRRQALTKTECHWVRETAIQTFAQAQQTISRIAAQYAPHRLAA